MEINARQGYWIALARAAGVNLSYIAYRDAIGRPCPACEQRDGVRWSDLLHDGPDSLRELRRGELSLRDWLEPLLGCAPMPTCRCAIRAPGSTRWRAR